jgi:hypothetical protein
MVNVAVPPGTLLPDAPYQVDNRGDIWMTLPDGTFVMVAYRCGRVTWVGNEPASLAGIRQAGYRFESSITYTQAMVTILLRVINRFESSLRAANLI